jgi:hypothetical protein
VVGVAAGVQDLQADLAAGGMHGVGDDAVLAHLPGEGELRSLRRAAPGEVGREAAGDDEAGAAARALGEEGRHRSKPFRRFLQAGVHGAHQRAVAQGGEAEVEGGEEVRVLRHMSSKTF